jgi:antitoxin component YwqK of YwqJK toxin-antitoxin module
MIQKNESVFEQNLALFSRFIPERLQEIRDADVRSFEFVRTEFGELNLIKHVGEETKYYHDPRGAKREAHEALQRIDLNSCDSLVIFGLGLGYFFDVLSPWLSLSKLRSLVFVEDDWGVINRFLHTEHASLLLSHLQVSFVLVPEDWKTFSVCADAFQKAKPFFIDFAWDWKYAVLPLYSSERKNDAELMYMRLIQYIYLLVGSWNLGIIHSESDRNFYWNLFEFTDAFSTEGMKGTLGDIPFLICGAGPSLKKQAANLARLQSKAIICGSGTGTNVLDHLGIDANWGVGVDPSEGEANRIKAQNAFLTPFFFDLRFAREGARFLHGPKFIVLLQDQTFWKEQLLKQLPLQNEIAVKLVVTSTIFATQVACALKLLKIVFAGVDLAYLEGKRYGSLENWLGGYRGSWVYEGVKVRKPDLTEMGTSYEFIMESQTLSFIADHNPSSRFFYASPEGQGILNVPTVDLAEWQDQENLDERDILNEIHAMIFTQPKIPVAYADIRRILEPWKKNLAEAGNELASYFKQTQEALRTNQEHKLPAEPNWDTDAFKGAAPLLKYYNTLLDARTEKKKRYLHVMRNQLGEPVFFQKLAWIQEKKWIFLQSVIATHIEVIDEVLDETFAREQVSDARNPPQIPEEEELIEDRSLEEFHTQHPPKTGVWVRLYPNGSPKARQSYRDGLLHGISQFFSPSGNLLAQSAFRSGKRIGTTKQYYQSGAVYSLQFWEEGQKIGVHEFFYENGELKAQLPYDKGRLNGEVSLYYQNGRLKFRSPFKDGMREGAFQLYGYSGQLSEEGYHERGVLKGMYRSFYPNGQVQLERDYDEEGNFDEREWSKKGTLIAERKLPKEDIETEILDYKNSIDQLLRGLQ